MMCLYKQSGLIAAEQDYPYSGSEHSCAFQSEKGVNKIRELESGVSNDEDELKKLVSEGVCSIEIDASHWSFQAYSSGIYDEPAYSSTALGHTVGLVGYGVEDGVDYWIVRNSWGTEWGEDGYIRMSRNKNNQCGIAAESYQAHS